MKIGIKYDGVRMVTLSMSGWRYVDDGEPYPGGPELLTEEPDMSQVKVKPPRADFVISGRWTARMKCPFPWIGSDVGQGYSTREEAEATLQGLGDLRRFLKGEAYIVERRW